MLSAVISIGRRLASSATLLLASAFLASSFTASSASSAANLKVAYSVWVGYGPLFIAQDKGFFADEGLDVELIAMDDVKLRMPALAAGRIDVAVSTVDALLTFYSADRPFRYLFAVDDSRGGDGIVARNEIKTVADLRGKTVAFTEGSVSHFFLGVLLKGEGLKVSDVDARNMTAGDAGAAFVAGQVDAAVTWEPWLTRGRAADHGHVLVDSSSTPGLITDVAIATETLASSRLEDLQAFYRAWNRAVEWRKSNEEEGDRIMAEGIGGWLEDPSEFAATRAGIVYYDRGMNSAFIGTRSSPGGIASSIANALELGREGGLFDHDLDPASLIAYDVTR